jgi:hypothetical protein
MSKYASCRGSYRFTKAVACSLAPYFVRGGLFRLSECMALPHLVQRAKASKCMWDIVKNKRKENKSTWEMY